MIIDNMMGTQCHQIAGNPLGDNMMMVMDALSVFPFGLVSSGRVLIGVVGPAGAGKSVLTSFLCPLLNKIYPREEDWAVCLSMDAYHHSNTYLDSHRVDGFPMGKDDDPTTVPTLRCIKGNSSGNGGGGSSSRRRRNNRSSTTANKEWNGNTK